MSADDILALNRLAYRYAAAVDTCDRDAFLDIFTADGEVFPVADALADAGVPIIFHSGHMSPPEVKRRYPQALACSKPCPPDHLIDLLQEAVEKARTDA